MAVLKKLVIGIALIFMAFIVVGLLLPSSFEVKRTVVIEAEPSTVYENIVDLQEWQSWGVWFKRDPNMVVTYAGPDRAVGMRSAWKSETEGNGEMEITALEHNRNVTYALRFPDMDMASQGELTLEPIDAGTRVTWRDYGDVGSNIVYRYFALFMDSLIGPDFEDGLANLKTVSENKIT
ncbi:SRPBCC family protein [Alteromonas oceanisediminis]|uniref:SRPBCC family protein n=1 Tax=Alteromonas oceanisediminis TaxID=2836180 RepID=UPI001BDAD6A9|nr:SRPBCC family protein [Alteromonas oceanisediminis]MBT0587246.1 SRPBCC family protein [Alteromonas oceanisediminis]